MKTSYYTNVSDEEWGFVAPYLTLSRLDSECRVYELREVFNGLRYILRAGCAWRLLPENLPPWNVVYRQTQRWIEAGVFEDLVHDLRQMLRVAECRDPQPSAIILDSRTLQSTSSSQGARYDGAKRKKGRKVHEVVDTMGHLLDILVTPANEQDRAQVGALCARVQELTGSTVEVAFVDQGYTGESAREAAEEHGIELRVIKHPEAKKGFVLLPRRWVAERSFGWMARFRRLARDYERLPETVRGLSFLSFTCLLLSRAAALFSQTW